MCTCPPICSRWPNSTVWTCFTAPAANLKRDPPCRRGAVAFENAGTQGLDGVSCKSERVNSSPSSAPMGRADNAHFRAGGPHAPMPARSKSWDTT